MLDSMLCAVLLLVDVDAGASALVVDATGFQHARGHALLRLYRPGMNVTHEPAELVRAPIVDGRAHFEVVGLAAGDYAVVVVHDENDNGVVDHGVFGPKEPLGFSNGFHLGLWSLLPTFEKLRFSFSPGDPPLAIRLR